ncbi:MAG: M16 family metallopeptidase [Acidobacteriota bacterium]
MSHVNRLALPETGPTLPFQFPAIHRRLLSSGMEIRVVAHGEVPMVCAVLLVRGGSAADPPARPGLTALTADLLDEGSGGRSAIEVSDDLAQCGAEFDVEVGPDAVVVELTMLSRFLRRGLELLVEMVSVPNLAEPDVDRVRKLRLDRLRQLREHAPAVAERAFMRLLYEGHPYGHLALGSEQALQEASLAEIRHLHLSAFRPDGSTLVLVGDARVEEFFDQATETFGRWNPGSRRDPVDRDAGLQTPPAAPSHRLAVVDRPKAAQSELRIGRVCASRRTPDYHALVLLNTILGGQFISRVNMNLRQGKGYTYGARTGFDLRRGLGPFALQTSVHTQVTSEAIREALREIEAIRTDRPASEEELAFARSAVTRGYPRGFETSAQIARAVAQLALHDLEDDYFAGFVPRVEAVPLEAVHRVAREHLDVARMTTLVVGDLATIAPAMAALGLGDAVVLDPGDGRGAA